MMRSALAIMALAVAGPASANVYELSPQGFVVRHQVEVPASADRAWDMLLRPSKWWSGAHSYSGDAKNLSLDARAGGCFCEVLPNRSSPNASPRGSVEHMRVVYVEQPRALRMIGGLGPLQSEAVNGSLTIFLKPVGEGRTQMMWEYIVGGYLRTDAAETAAGVDQVLGEQLMRLAKGLGAEVPVAKAADSALPKTKSPPSPSVPEDRRFEGR